VKLIAAIGRALVLAVVLSGAACSVPVKAEHTGAEDVYARLHENVLTGSEPSVAALLTIERAGLSDEYEHDPGAALVALHRAAESADTRERLYGLAELSLHEGIRTGGQRWYLGSAVYAYLYLFGQADAPPPGPFDPRFRLACDVYARGLAGAFRDEDSGEFRPRSGLMALPVGNLNVALPQESLVLGGATFDMFRSADEFTVEGMRSRLRTEGLGAPLIAGRRNPPENLKNVAIGAMRPNMNTAATAMLDVSGEFADLGFGRAKATLLLHAPLLGRRTTVRGQDVPLAFDITTPVAYGLTTSKLWHHEIFSFMKGEKAEFDNGLIFMAPYQRGKIPLILVHGTASSPARWAELLNEVAADRELASRYQAWLFIYSTGAPVLVSAASLRQSILETVKALDPNGEDPALSHMVVVGHSQGGLLTRLMATSSGDRFWRNFTDKPFDSMNFDDEERKLFKETMFFEPIPQVERLVFLATPHKGSYVAGGFLGSISSSLVSLPKSLANNFSDAVTRNFAKVTGDKIGALPTAVDNMKPDSVFCKALEDLPISPRVHAHSIVAVDGDGPPEEGDDGVVAYESAHLPSAESELVVRSPHSCQGNPRTILEVRRILHRHLDAVSPPAPAK
jgi:pimeloyl-ACP methyl ester carboxylesterase